jgi:hypothetical protein
MTTKDKAKELVDKYYIICQEFTEEIQCSIQAKQCALIAVEEILKYNKNQLIHWMPCENDLCGCYDYWNEVKHEIEKL